MATLTAAETHATLNYTKPTTLSCMLVQEGKHDGDGWHAIVVVEQPQNHILSHPINTSGKGKIYGCDISL
ncbi:hypothetical protein Pcinc_025699 [Petrolisthes cinctipes]|uniref:Uncharacterized protein n=1 Tax=Petrolisthes cinctipes TaxID=88211 RepID=A0AAE1F7E0_PETCI|nr:hypothetical protein Pcinc_025699 [Petrolisthes cinctipes]